MTPTRRGALLAALVLVVAAGALLGPALFSGKVLSAGDKQYFQAPFVAEKPAGLARPGNGDLADAVDVFHPHLLEAGRPSAPASSRPGTSTSRPGSGRRTAGRSFH